MSLAEFLYEHQEIFFLIYHSCSSHALRTSFCKFCVRDAVCGGGCEARNLLLDIDSIWRGIHDL